MQNDPINQLNLGLAYFMVTLVLGFAALSHF